MCTTRDRYPQNELLPKLKVTAVPPIFLSDLIHTREY